MILRALSIFFFFYFTLLQNQKISGLQQAFIEKKIRTRACKLSTCVIRCSLTTSKIVECPQGLFDIQTFKYNALHKGQLPWYRIHLCYLITLKGNCKMWTSDSFADIRSFTHLSVTFESILSWPIDINSYILCNSEKVFWIFSDYWKIPLTVGKK